MKTSALRVTRKPGLAFALLLSLPLSFALSAPAAACGHIAMFVDSTYSSSEPGMVTVAIRRDANACGGPSSVDYTTMDESAKAGSDYTATAGTVTFNNPEPSGAQRTFTVPILDDSQAEGAETFKVVLRMNAVQGGAITSTGPPSTITIAANDQPAAPSAPTTAAPTAPAATTAPPTAVRPGSTTSAPSQPPKSVVTPTTGAAGSTVPTTTALPNETTTTSTGSNEEIAASPTSSDRGGDGGGAAPIIALIVLAFVVSGGIGYWLWQRSQSPVAADNPADISQG